MKIQKWAVLAALCALLVPVASFAQDDFDDNRPPNGPTDVGPAEGGPIEGGTNVPGPNDAPPVPDRVYVAEEDALNALPAMLAQGPGGVSLQASEAAFDANPVARTALLNWVSEGGTVFLHTGAARAFGYVTVEARQGSNDAAGQLYGRATAAVPFGAHPLLWDDGQLAPLRPNADPTLLPGVNTVFYQLRPGDHLVVSHAAGTPLLRASDLAANSPEPLYSAAIAPFGRGFAVFTPDTIDQKRGDGALFVRNLVGLLSPSKTVGRQWVGIPASVVLGAATNPANLRTALVQAATVSLPRVAPALPAFGTAEAPRRNNRNFDVPAVAPPAFRAPAAPVTAPADDAPEAPIIDTATIGEPLVYFSRNEATSYIAMLDEGGARASAATNLLRVRLFLARGDDVSAAQAIEATADFAPNGSPGGAEVSLWRGFMLAALSQELNQSSRIRANLLADAARNLAAAANGAVRVNNPNARSVSRVGGISVNALRSWSAKFNAISQVFALEPPFVQVFGQGDSRIILRGFQDDTTLQLVSLAVSAVADARNFGWRGDREEVIVFPTIQLFTQYRAALGLTTATVPLPAGSGGDVLGQRLIMVAVPSLPLVETDPQTGLGRVFAGGNNTASLFARLHSYVLLNALDEGGTGIPTYMQLGLEGLIAKVIDGPTLANNNQVLEQFARAGGLLTPEQFVASEPDPVRYQVGQLQAAAIVAYIYDAYGPGAFVETVQRLGAGQTPDEALQATTEGDQLALFQNWRDSQFGKRNFPNAG
jgi:hypothetical protein